MPVLSNAETMYITDTLQFAIRSGMGVEYKILKFLKSNDKVDVVATEGEYSKLRLDDGAEGWILTRYLKSDTPKSNLIEDLQSQIEKLKEKNNNSRETIIQYGEDIKELESIKKTQEHHIKNLENEFNDLKSSSTDYLLLKSEHEKLKEEMTKNTRTISKLNSEKEELREKTNLMWFVAGSSAVLIGFIIGFALQNLRYKRKRPISF
jgi:SH3 domain protein